MKLYGSPSPYRTRPRWNHGFPPGVPFGFTSWLHGWHPCSARPSTKAPLGFHCLDVFTSPVSRQHWGPSAMWWHIQRLPIKSLISDGFLCVCVRRIADEFSAVMVRKGCFTNACCSAWAKHEGKACLVVIGEPYQWGEWPLLYAAQTIALGNLIDWRPHAPARQGRSHRRSHKRGLIRTANQL